MTLVQPYNLTAAVMFVTEDLNNDGVMTVTEIDTIFDKYDTNGMTLFISNAISIPIKYLIYDI